ncbi:STM4015 family protein [Dokdonella sp. MW10]|uniref:STM4015 family protein n=1 Tax=Dokdonella sp. MW10 TaxID=2992926 RepID=UPI003F7E316E
MVEAGSGDDGAPRDGTRRRLVASLAAGGVALAVGGCGPRDPLPQVQLPINTQEPPMSRHDTPDTFRGKRVVDFAMGDKASSGDVVYRLRQDYDTKESQRELVEHFFTQIAPGSLESLIVGVWQVSHDDGPDGILDVLVERRGELAALRHLYVGDIQSEDNEMSWIIQTGYTRVLDAFPALESLRVRGGEKLAFEPFEHASLRELAVETGGLPTRVVEGIARSRMPALKHLELWLGDDNYGFDGDLATYVRLLEAIDPTRLEYLGLRNSQITDELAGYLAQQPWIGGLDTLDLSMGTLGDDGALALLKSPHLGGLKHLNLAYHYVGAEYRARLAALPLDVDVSDPQDPDDYDGERYVAIGE